MNGLHDRRVTRGWDRRLAAALSLVVVLLTAGAAAAEEPWEPLLEPDPTVAKSLPPEQERQVETLEQKGGFIGYGFVATDGYGGRAEPFGFLRSSRTGGLFYRNLQRDGNLEVEGAFLNEHDYHGDLLLDYQGDYRLHLRTESLFHNLDREILFSPNFQAGRVDPPRTPADYVAVQDPEQDYGVSVVQDNADFRYRLHNYPLHVNLGYWRLVREGTRQQRFADIAFEGTPNTIYATPRNVNQQTQEGRVGADAHLGPVDLAYEFKIRVFEDRQPIPTAPYVSRNDIAGNPETVGGVREHNENPDSRFVSHTLKVHSSMSGGLVASGAYSVEQRENLSNLSDTTGAKSLREDLHNAAGDLSYILNKEWSATVKYRRQQLENDGRGEVTSVNFASPVVLVKAPMDTTRDTVTATVAYHPRRDFSMTGEYRGQFQQRSNVSSLQSYTSWALPEDSASHRGAISANYRPVTGLRFNGSYSYTTVDHPSYGASYQEKHEGKLLASFIRNNGWGGSANLIVRRELNPDVQHFLVNLPVDPTVSTDVTYTAYPLTSRDRQVVNGNLIGWFVPLPGLTLGANYAYLDTRIDQSVLFSMVAVGHEAGSDFYDRSHVFGVSATYTGVDRLDLSLMLQQVRSASAFEPAFTSFSAGSDTSGITDITRQKTVISQLSARGEYHFTPMLSSSLQYQVRDYDEKNPAYSLYNGTVHSVVATVAATW
ncbi:outer membrane channel lipoprotein [Geomonas sp. Red276]